MAVKTKVTKDNAETLEVNFTIGAAEMDTARQKALESLAPQVKISGFRKGKVPSGVAEKHIDPNIMIERQLDIAVKSNTTAFLEKHGGQYVNQPMIDVTKFVPGEMAEWTLKIDKAPVVKLGDYKKLKVKVSSKEKDALPSLDDLVDALIASSKVPTPNTLVEAHIRQMMQQIAQDLSMQQKSYEDLLKEQKVKDETELRDKVLKPIAIKRTQSELVLNTLANDLKITVSDSDLDAQLTTLRQHYYNTPELSKILDNPNVQADIRGRMRIDRTLAKLAEAYTTANPVKEPKPSKKSNKK